MTDKQIRLLGEALSTREALEMVAELIHVQIRFHEGRIRRDNHAAEVRARNTEIRRLQRELYEVSRMLETGKPDVYTETYINLKRHA